jgi:hypothetical protein
MFFILCDKPKIDIIRDEDRDISYPVIDVVKRDSKGMGIYMDSSSSSSSDNSSNEDRRNSISRRMVEKFLEMVGLKEDFSPRWSLLEPNNPQ